MNNDLFGTKKSKILISLLSGPKKMTELQDIISSYDVLRYNVLELQTEGLITRKEYRDSKRRYQVTLTPKGKEVATRLQEAQDVSDGIIHVDGQEINITLNPEEQKNSQYLKYLFHFNVLDNHITVEEAVPGKPSRIFNIYIKQNGGGYFRLWCEADNSFDCWHVKEAWGYPQVQKMMMRYKGKTKICPACGYENPEEAVYCMKCATKLD